MVGESRNQAGVFLGPEIAISFLCLSALSSSFEGVLGCGNFLTVKPQGHKRS